MAQFPELIQALLDPKTYPDSPSRVNLNDLKSLYPNLDIAHLTVDTSQDLPEQWYITGMEKR
ncbi:hypothetical protein ES703_16120 [subsurface metagenome]|nr:hypothetical protein [Dehalococcoidia bacterium]